MLMPKRVKRRKQFRGSMKGKALRGNKITNGEYGIVAMEPCWIRSNQIEAARIAMTRYIKRGGKVWIKIFPDKPVTTKPDGGHGGPVTGHINPSYPGIFLFSFQIAVKAYFSSGHVGPRLLASHKPFQKSLLCKVNPEHFLKIFPWTLKRVQWNSLPPFY